jgi:fatty acid desaturase
VPDADPAYAALRQCVLQARLLDRARGYYAWRTALSFGILAAGILLVSPAPAIAALLIAFGSVQVGLVGHDAAHGAVFRSRLANVILGSLCWSVALGVSFRYWHARHSRHHASPNDPASDPDMQWEFGPGLLPFLAFTLRVEGWRYVVASREIVDLVLVSVSALAWLAPTILFGPSWIFTLLASQVLASLYLGGAVAPNHIGMPVWSGGAAPTFLERQLASSRNVAPGWIADFVFGGLNYQIEHHLFPSMPRNHFASARVLVKTFCRQRGLPYTECGVASVYRLILAELPRLVQPDRA